MIDIRQAKSGDYVKTKTGMEKIQTIHGVGSNGELAPPSQGGFSVTTESGRVVSMWEARSYHSAAEVDGVTKS